MNIKVIRWLLLLGLVSGSYFSIQAASLFNGIPGIRNFSRWQYSGGIQTWSFTETENGLLYFANNSGLLEYNGSTWSLYQAVNAVNRVVCADGNRVYIGAFNDFGYYEENERGSLTYHSLTPLLNNKFVDFDEIWRIHKTDFGIVFQSFKAIFVYKDEKIEVIKPQSSFHLSYFVNGKLWVFDEAQGLMQYQAGRLKPVPGGDFFRGMQIWSILPINDDEVIIGTSKNGLFRYAGDKVKAWGSEINERLRRYQLYSAKKLKDNYFAFGTIQNGLIVTDTAGKLIFEMNKERGLQNNTVLGIGQDYKGNIWLCLDNGISMIEFDTPISFFQQYFDIGTGYASAKFGSTIYLGTNQGLFYIHEKDFADPSKSKSSFKLIEGTEGQVWTLSVIDNTLLCGHNSGVFQVMGDKAQRIYSIPGTWNFLKIDKKGLVLVGTYTGLYVLEKKGNNWVYRNKIEGFNESSRFVQDDQIGNIWVSQTYKGIFRIKSDDLLTEAREVQLYNSKNGLPANQSNLLFKIHAEIMVASTKGIFAFNHNSSNFEKVTRFLPYFDDQTWVDYLYEDSGQNVWFSANNAIGVLRLQEDGSFKKISLPFLKLSNHVIPSFEHIHELDQNNVMIGIEGGFANYVPKYRKDYSQPCAIFISSLKSGDTTEGIYRHNSKKSSQALVPAFRHRHNTVSISYSANDFESPEVLFQYRLLGFDEKWSEWTTKTFKEYTNLPSGHYTFVLRASNNELTTPTELSFKFDVLAPWYWSVYAIMLYLFGIAVLIYFGRKYFVYRIEKRHLEEKQLQKEKYLALERKHKEEALIAEKEVERLRNDALRLEMVHKEKELANSTMLVIKKNDILSRLQSDLQAINAALTNDSVKNSIKSLIKRIEKEIDNEKQWKVFDMHIEQVYDDLFRKLKESYPDLTPRELSLCAYLRMNISSKEIATLMNISARGVEISRYRIRKKLRLDRDDNLTEFMLNL